MPANSPVARASSQSDGYKALDILFDEDVGPLIASGRPESSLSYGRRMVLNLYGLTAEINNGGFVQYIWNSTGKDVVALVDNLDTLGAREIATAIKGFLSKVWGAATVPADTEERRAHLERFFGAVPFNFDDQPRTFKRDPDVEDTVTSVFYAQEEHLVGSFLNWIKRHQDDFMEGAD